MQMPFSASNRHVKRPWLAAIICIAGLVAASDAGAVRLDRIVTFRVIDAQSTKPVPEVFAVADEQVETHVWAPGHGRTFHTCIRSGAAHSRDGTAVVSMKSSGAALSLGDRGSLRFYVYAPGYCTSQSRELQGDAYAIRATRATDPPENRLFALSDIAMRFQGSGSCGEKRTPQAKAALAAVVAEAKSIAATPYERHLAELLEHFINAERFEHGIEGSPGPAPSLGHSRGFAIVDEQFGKQSPSWSISNTRCYMCGSPIVVQYGSQRVPGPPQYRLVCRDAANCDFEQRGSEGQTYLLELIANADVPRASILLAAGANPEASTYPGGPTGLDFLLDRLHQTATAAHFEQAATVIRELAKDGRATVDPKRLEAWMARRPWPAQTAAAASQIAADLQTIRPRPAFSPACPASGDVSIGLFWRPYQPGMNWPASARP